MGCLCSPLLVMSSHAVDVRGMHGEDRHSSMSSLQLCPSQPPGHVQWYAAMRSLQLPRTQGLERHSSMLISQLKPSNPL